MNLNIAVVYHANCIDGFTAAWIMNKRLEKDGTVTLLPCDYNKRDDLIKELDYDIVYAVDFSFTRKQLEQIHAPVVIIDHHKTAIEEHTTHNRLSHVDYIFDLNESGASLCWKFAFPKEPMPEIVKYVKDYDLWRFEFGDDTRYLHQYMITLDKTIKEWNRIMGLQDLDTIKLVGKAYHNYHMFVVNQIIPTAFTISRNSRVGLGVYAPAMFSSELGNGLAKITGTFGEVIYFDEDGTECHSIRSIGDCDVEEIAKSYGGGGHKNAAGWRIPK